MKTILVPTDFSANADNALNYAAAIANQVEAKLILAHIINLSVTPLENGVTIPPDAHLETDLQQKLTDLANAVQTEYGYRFKVETICQYGYFLSNLKELVKEQAVDLTVMGTHGATNFLDRLIGTNTSEFIKIAACPVLAIPPGAKFTGIKNIAYSSDFECEETVFLKQLFGFSDPLQAQVYIVNILTERQSNIFNDNQVIRYITQRFTDKNFSIAQIQERHIIEGLHHFVQDNQVDVLAVSVHQRGFFEELFHQSISKQLIYHTTVPLLALPEKPYQVAGNKTASLTSDTFRQD